MVATIPTRSSCALVLVRVVFRVLVVVAVLCHHALFVARVDPLVPVARGRSSSAIAVHLFADHAEALPARSIARTDQQ
ncbi:MAG TPA: hypothetical protein VE441_14780 [Mycobacterium sp.]|nr:hypothetical protein [Mycobacterium sp.]